MRPRTVAALAGLWTLATLAVPAATPDRAATEGRALAADLCAQRPATNSQTSGVLEIRAGNGQRARVPFTLQIIAGDSVWKAVYEAFSPAHTPLEKLIVVHAGDRPVQYWRALPDAPGGPLGQPAAVQGAPTTNAFAGSDFSLADLGLAFLHWPKQRLLKHEMRKGRPCKVLESANPDPAPDGYARVVSWVDNETGGILYARAYDPRNRLLKEFSVHKLKKVNGRWELKDLELCNVQTDSRTHLVYDTDSSDSP
jgi:Outer membrane lipoprotein-sorting protein